MGGFSFFLWWLLMTRHILLLLKFLKEKKEKKPYKISPLFLPEFIFKSVKYKRVSKIKTFFSKVKNLSQPLHIIKWVLQKNILRRWKHTVVTITDYYEIKITQVRSKDHGRHKHTMIENTATSLIKSRLTKANGSKQHKLTLQWTITVSQRMLTGLSQNGVLFCFFFLFVWEPVCL